MLKTNTHSLLSVFLCIGLISLTFAFPATSFAQQNPYELEQETRPSGAQRFFLENAAGLGVWTAAAASSGLLFWGLSYMDCPNDPDAPHACAPVTIATMGTVLLVGAAFVVTPIVVKMVGNRRGAFGSAILSGLVGLASSALLAQASLGAGPIAALILIPFGNVLGNTITFELTHTPPPRIEGVTNSTFQLQPGFNVGFKF